MSTFEWFQLLWNLITLGALATLSVFHLRARRVAEPQSLDLTASEGKWDALAIRMTQLEVDGRKNQEIAIRSVEALEQRVECLQRIVEESLETVSAPTVEANELRHLVAQKDEIPTVRQMERTKLRLNQEAQIDLRTLLREQLA